jgi:Transcriptional Coactivator p15 (PC4)
LKEKARRDVSPSEPGKEKISMKKLAEPATSFNNNTPVWSAEFPLNQRNFLRVEIIYLKDSPVLSLRCWFRPADGPARPTKRGITFAIRHLPSAARHLNQALGQARAAGLLSDGGADV